MCSIGLKSGLQDGLLLKFNTAVKSKSISNFFQHRVFSLIQIEIRKFIKTKV